MRNAGVGRGRREHCHGRILCCRVLVNVLPRHSVHGGAIRVVRAVQDEQSPPNDGPIQEGPVFNRPGMYVPWLW